MEKISDKSEYFNIIENLLKDHKEEIHSNKLCTLFHIQFELAQRLLYQYIKENYESLSIRFLITGLLPDSSRAYMVTPIELFEETKAKFIKVESIQIHSACVKTSKVHDQTFWQKETKDVANRIEKAAQSDKIWIPEYTTFSPLPVHIRRLEYDMPTPDIEKRNTVKCDDKHEKGNSAPRDITHPTDPNTTSTISPPTAKSPIQSTNVKTTNKNRKICATSQNSPNYISKPKLNTTTSPTRLKANDISKSSLNPSNLDFAPNVSPNYAPSACAKSLITSTESSDTTSSTYKNNKKSPFGGKSIIPTSKRKKLNGSTIETQQSAEEDASPKSKSKIIDDNSNAPLFNSDDEKNDLLEEEQTHNKEVGLASELIKNEDSSDEEKNTNAREETRKFKVKKRIMKDITYEKSGYLVIEKAPTMEVKEVEETFKVTPTKIKATKPSKTSIQSGILAYFKKKA